MFDWTVNLGNLLTIASMFVVGLGYLYTMKDKIESMSARLLVLEGELKKLIDVLIQQGKHEERMLAMDARMVNQGQRLDDLIKRFNEQLDSK